MEIADLKKSISEMSDKESERASENRRNEIWLYR